jgi:hypothetical protein
MSAVGTLQPPGTQLIESATVFDGPVTFTPGTPLSIQGPTTTQSINGTGTAPTPAAVTAGAGAGSSVASFKGHDLGGSFVLTAAGTPAAGPVATITFGTALAAAPVAVVVSITDTTGSPILAIAGSAGAFAATGFSVVAPALTAAHTYLISYQVVAS